MMTMVMMFSNRSFDRRRRRCANYVCCAQQTSQNEFIAGNRRMEMALTLAAPADHENLS